LAKLCRAETEKDALVRRFKNRKKRITNAVKSCRLLRVRLAKRPGNENAIKGTDQMRKRLKAQYKFVKAEHEQEKKEQTEKG